MEHLGTQRLETRRLILRRFEPGDLEPMYENCWRHRSVTEWTSYAPMDCLADVQNNAKMFTEKWLCYDDPKRYSWAIEEKATGQVIGRMFGMDPDDSILQVDLAYELGPDWWNRGLMTEAVQAVLSFFLRVLLRSRFLFPSDLEILESTKSTNIATIMSVESA